MQKEMRQLVLNKGGEKFIFRYDDEDSLLDALMEQASNEKYDFDWYDAAVLSSKLARSLIIQAENLLQE